MTLQELGIKYQTDKATLHKYCDVYENFLKEKDIKNIIEVGIYFGGSLRMWSEFYPKANVIGLDNFTPSLFNEGNIKCFYADQNNPKETIMPMVINYDCDLFIDDASHLWSHQINTFNAVFPIMKKGSVYILEDICTSLWYNSGYDDCDTNPLEFIKQFIKENNINAAWVDVNPVASMSVLLERN